MVENLVCSPVMCVIPPDTQFVPATVTVAVAPSPLLVKFRKPVLLPGEVEFAMSPIEREPKFNGAPCPIVNPHVVALESFIASGMTKNIKIAIIITFFISYTTASILYII